MSAEIIDGIKERKFDVGLIESPVMNSDMIYREWLEDELVVVSNVPIPKILKTEELYDYRWICREESSHTRKVVSEVFEELGVSCKSLDVISEVSNTTAVLQTIKRSKKNEEKPVVSIISRHAIADEVAAGELFEARLRGYTMTRKFYIVYSKANKHNAYVDNVVDYILTGRC
jgi:DNA-binding transcriptional LysR family regulator